MRVFLAFAFRADDQEIVRYIDRLVASHGLQSRTGEGLGGEKLTDGVQLRIDQSDALVGLATRRDARQDGGYTTHQWVLDEAGYARAQKKKVVLIVEDGVDIGGMYQPHEYISLKSGTSAEAMLRLSEALREWKEERGRSVKVQILPPSVAHSLGSAKATDCSYRLWLRGKQSGWTKTTAVPEGGGAFVWIDGVQDDHLIQIQVANGRKTWTSPATSQWLQVSLKAEK